MAPDRFRFDCFELDPDDRQLRRDGKPVELNARYFDALALLVCERGKLVSKDRFLEEVWHGVPVTDEALTQCVRTLRRQLGDDAARPRFIETVPKHGYRFIAPVESGNTASGAAPALPLVARDSRWQPVLMLALAGTIGAGVSGILGGLFYGFAAAAQPAEAGIGAVSVLLVLTCITIVVALIGGAGVSLGIAAAELDPGRRSQWSIVGGGLGGLIVGAFVKLLGLDAFRLLFGQSPGDITGAAEGALLGAAVGLGAWLGDRGSRRRSLRRSAATAAAAGAAGAILIVLLGGCLLGGSLDLLARHLPGSRLRLDQIGAFFGEEGFGPISQIVTAGVEGGLFGGFLVGAMLLARRHGASGERG